MNPGNHTFIVTGGASGLGLACVRRLVACGARVLVVDRNAAAGASLVAELGGAVRFAAGDVASETDMQSAVNAAVGHSEGAGLRGLVNCAGIVIGEKLLGKNGPHALETFRRVIEVNLVGTFNASRLAAAAIAQAEPDENGERGVIIHTASIAAFEGQIGQVAYAASKGAVASITLPMARELGRQGIRVAAIAPGPFETPMVGVLPEKVVTSLEQQTVFPARLGRPDEFAALVLHVIENPMLNGCVIRLDGGIRLNAK